MSDYRERIIYETRLFSDWNKDARLIVLMKPQEGPEIEKEHRRLDIEQFLLLQVRRYCQYETGMSNSDLVILFSSAMGVNRYFLTDEEREREFAEHLKKYPLYHGEVDTTEELSTEEELNSDGEDLGPIFEESDFPSPRK